MDLTDLLHVLWRRKLVILFVTTAVVGIAVVALRIVSPVYEATSTLALGPEKLDTNTFFFYGTMDSIVPVYADAATSRITQDEAENLLGRDLAEVSVETFEGTPIIKINSRSTDPERAVGTTQAVSEALIDRSTRGDIGIPQLELTQLDRPVVPRDPVFPDRNLTIIVAVLLGLTLGTGAAILRENLTTTVESAEDLARIADAPSYGEIPQESAVSRMNAPEDLVTNPRLGMVSEALRDLRTNLLFSEGNLRSIIVSSPDGSHGKTTVSFGLAVTLARSGTRTLLVDGDLRRGRLSELMKIPRTPGLMEVLLGESTFEDAVRRTAMESLDVLTGGRRAGDPGELLTAEFPAILQQLEEQYETVVVDGTPLVPVSDARVMARFADATLIVASAGAATRRQVRTAVDRLSLISVRPTAVVLNNSKRSPGSSYYIVTEGEQAERPRRARRAVRR